MSNIYIKAPFSLELWNLLHTDASKSGSGFWNSADSYTNGIQWQLVVDQFIRNADALVYWLLQGHGTAQSQPMVAAG